MRLALTSDTHRAHHKLEVPDVDVLVHAGDFTSRGTRAEAEDFLRWLGQATPRFKVLVAGNHDWAAERDEGWFRDACRHHGVRYLVDEVAEIDGLVVWGSPMTPRFRDMAFNRDRGSPIRAHWNKMPSRVDVVVSHGPPQGILDATFLGAPVGCADLREVVEARQPALHVFGHIHEARGEVKHGRTTYLNVACRPLLPVAARPMVVTTVP